MSKKEKMKVYHGIPKSHIDGNTVFYASFDGTVIPEIGNEPTVTTPSFTPNATGLGVSTNLCIPTLRLDNKYVYTCDLWVDTSVISSLKGTTNQLYIMRGREKSDTNNSFLLYYVGTNNIIYIACDKKSGSYAQTYATMPLDSKFTHFRVVSTISGLKVYINGIIVMSINIPYTDRYDFDMLYNSMSGQRYTTNKICDLHISDIDRGDYFPNLPQDFIEGKAIIKPRMGQQQIKGDPLYSQTTELLVDSSAKLPKPYNNIANSDGTYTHLYKPELSVLNANLWNNASKLKIKGLNGEIISGVIDSDTALCKITKDIPQTSGNSNVSVSVDDTSRLSVGDTLTLVYLANGNSYSNFLTVVSVDSSTEFTGKVWSGGGSVSINNRAYLFENTASSSSPVVKSEDGTTVVGTWSGLGTNEATFTLGDNTGLKGKDLYVTYSLNIPSGNSDFSELPYSVDRAYNEVGLEMNPVTEIVIEDDFRGKISGSTKECPHKAYRSYSSSLMNPSDITTDTNTGFVEMLQNHLGAISTVNKSCTEFSVNADTKISQVLLSFDVISIVEQKLGESIPSADKVQWLKDNVDRVIYYNYAYGECPSGNKIYNRYYKDNRWSGGYVSTTPSPIQYQATFKVDFPSMIDDNGFIHFLIYTDMSNGSVKSSVYLDYVNIEVTLKTDSTFTTLYCDNKRAREDSCNPILIQKETKTVKRYLPSKECFVTECSYATIPSASVQQPIGAKKVSSHGRYFLSSKGTGSVGSKICNAEYLGQFLNKDILYKYSGSDLIEIPYSLFVDKSSNNDYSSYFTQLELLDIDDNAIKYLLFTKANIGYKSSHGISRGFSKHLSLLDNKPESSFYGIAIYLVRYNNELYLLISNAPYNFDMNTNKEGVSDLYKLPNRPLIK